MQAQTLQLDPNRVLTNIYPIHITGYSLTSPLLSLDNNLIYSAGNHIVVDPIDGSQSQYTLRGHDNTITSFCIFGSSTIASGQLGSPGNKNYDSPVLMWKLSMSKPTAMFQGLKEGVKNICFSENGQFLAGVSHKDQFIIWDVKSQKQIFARIFEAPVNILHFNNESLVITLGKGIQQANITPLLSQNKPPVFTNFTLPSTGLPRNYTSLIKIDNNEYLIGTQSGEICFFEKGVFKSATIVGKGKVFSIGSLHNKIDIYAAVGTELVRYEFINNNLKERNRSDGYHGRRICISPKDQIFVLSSVGLLSSDRDLKIKTLRNSHGMRINGVSSKGGVIASIDQQRLMTRQYHSNKVTFLGAHYSNVNCLGTCCVVGEDLSIFAGYNNGAIVNLTTNLGKVNWQIGGHKGAVTNLYSTSNYFLSGGEDCVVRIWASGTKQLINQISAHQKTVSRVLGDFQSPHIIHSCSHDRSIHSYDMKSDKKLSFRQAPKGTITSMDQSASNGELVTCGPGAGVGIWKPNQYQPSLTLEVGHLKLLTVCLNPSGNIVAIGSENGDVYLFNIKNKNYLGVIVAHSREVTGLAWVDDKILTSVSDDQTLAVWNIA